MSECSRLKLVTTKDNFRMDVQKLTTSIANTAALVLIVINLPQLKHLHFGVHPVTELYKLPQQYGNKRTVELLLNELITTTIIQFIHIALQFNNTKVSLINNTSANLKDLQPFCFLAMQY